MTAKHFSKLTKVLTDQVALRITGKINKSQPIPVHTRVEVLGKETKRKVLRAVWKKRDCFDKNKIKLMADFSTWKPEDNGVLSLRARILHPVKTILKMGKTVIFRETKMKRNTPTADLQ